MQASADQAPPPLRRKRLIGPTGWRWILAGPVAFLLSVLLMASLPFVLPAGRGEIDHLLLPVVLFPLIWSVLVVLPVATDNLTRMSRIYAGVFFFCCVVIAASFLT